MTGNFLLDWAALAVSLLNTILLLWLGLTVLLNAERRTPGIWVSGGMLLVGAGFFIIHSVLLGHGPGFLTQGMDFWWRAGWFPVVGLPYAWYGVMLWYAGFWNIPRNPLYKRHRPWMASVTLLAGAILGMLFLANPVPSYDQVATLELTSTFSIGGIPVLILGYPLYILACIILAVDVLLHPAPSGRLMGDLARRRARAWLVGGSFVLLIVSLLVGWVVWWVTLDAQQPGLAPEMITTIAWFDLIIAALIAFAILLVGQSIVSYEIFTGKILPRSGLRRLWGQVLLLAVGFAVLGSWGLTRPLLPIYTLLLGALLVTAFVALSGWQAYTERESDIRRLRPFVASPRIYEHLTTQSAELPPGPDASASFEALCRDVLDSSCAYLIPLGRLAPLAGQPLCYPSGAGNPVPSLADLDLPTRAPHILNIPLDARQYGGATWAVPLWSERGLIGALLLGEKRAGGLFTQEEIEIARAAAERLLDLQASTEIARRLMNLQRQRMAEGQVLDQKTRRVLHDEVLPGIHAVLLELSNLQPGAPLAAGQSMQALTQVHQQVSDLLHNLPPAANPEVARLGLLEALQQTVAGDFRQAFDAITWQISSQAELHCREIPPTTAEVVYYAAREVIRNAARHARPLDTQAPLELRIQADWDHGLEILIEDNGQGLSSAAQPPAGSGQGLTLHSTLMAVIGGSLTIESTPRQRTQVSLRLPVSNQS